LLFLHADTELPHGALDCVHQALASGVPHWGRFDVCISGQHWMLRVIGHMMNLRSRLTGIATGDQALFMTRAVFDAVGGFPDQALMEDIELFKRLRCRSRPACISRCVSTSGLGNTRGLVHHGSDVAPALALLAWCPRRPTGARLPMKPVRLVIFAKAPLSWPNVYFAIPCMKPCIGCSSSSGVLQAGPCCTILMNRPI
jgi:hypothetical protein